MGDSLRRRTKVALVCAAVVVVGGTGAIMVPVLVEAPHSQASDRLDASGTLQLRTAKVERTSLAQGTVISGTLARGASVPLPANREGVVTRLPLVGDVVRSGDCLFEVDGRPTLLLRGTVPLWRPLQVGARGADVTSLNRALVAAELLDPTLADDTFGPGTSAAIARLYESAGYVAPSSTDEGMQRINEAEGAHRAASDALVAAERALTEARRPPSSLERAQADQAVTDAEKALAEARASGEAVGLAQAQYDDVVAAREALVAPPDVTAQDIAVQEGRRAVADAMEALEVARGEFLRPGDLVLLDMPEIQIAAVSSRLGEHASGGVLEWTGTVVHAEAQVTRSQQASLALGDQVTVQLPTGAEVGGRIASVGAVTEHGDPVAEPEVDSQASDGTAGDTVRLIVELDAQEDAVALVGAVVRIEVTAATVPDTLVVPVTALVALTEGGYAVEKVDREAPGGSRLVPVEVGIVAETRVQVTSGDLRENDEVLVP